MVLCARLLGALVVAAFIGDSLSAVPVLTGNNAAVIRENVASGTTIVTVTADQSVEWSVTGTDGALFQVTPTNGTTTTLKTGDSAVIDFESKTTLSVTVTASNTVPETANHAVTVTVTNVNEPPFFDSTKAAVVPNGATAGTVVVTCAATDPDAGTTLAYAITHGGGNKFSVGNTGVISVKAGVTLSEQNEAYFLKVTAKDDATVSLTATNTVGIFVGNCTMGCSISIPACPGSGAEVVSNRILILATLVLGLLDIQFVV